MTTISSKQEGEITDEQRFSLFLTQVEALYNQVDKRMELRQQLQFWAYAIGSGLLSFVALPGASSLIILFGPWVVLCLAAALAQHEWKIGQINWHMRAMVEKWLGKFGPGWETHRHDTFEKSEDSSSGEKQSVLAQPKGLVELSNRGTFTIVNTILIFAGVARALSLLLETGFPARPLTIVQIVLAIVTTLLVLSDLGICVKVYMMLAHPRIRKINES